MDKMNVSKYCQIIAEGTALNGVYFRQCFPKLKLLIQHMVGVRREGRELTREAWQLMADHSQQTAQKPVSGELEKKLLAKLSRVHWKSRRFHSYQQKVEHFNQFLKKSDFKTELRFQVFNYLNH